jgi:hypothetical protein
MGSLGRSSSSNDVKRVQFHVPPSTLGTPTRSMFAEVNASQIDRTLYDHRDSAALSTQEALDSECGSIHISLHFDESLSLLTVCLLAASELKSQRTDGPPNLYVRVTLAKPTLGARTITQQSKIYKGEASPQMTDEFVFDVRRVYEMYYICNSCLDPKWTTQRVQIGGIGV